MKIYCYCRLRYVYFCSKREILKYNSLHITLLLNNNDSYYDDLNEEYFASFLMEDVKSLSEKISFRFYGFLCII